MPPTRSLQHPIYVSTELANVPFRIRRKSLSEDELPNPDYYLVPPSPSLSPSRSFSMSSSPPSSPTTINTSPARPHHLDTARIHPPSSPTRPAPYHAYGYAHSYSRGFSHHVPADHDLPPAEPKGFVPNSRSHPHAIIPPANINRSSFSPPPSDDLRPSFAALPQNNATHDEDTGEDDSIEEECGFALGLDDILAGSSPTRRVSFTTSDERDRPFVRPPVLVKPKPCRPSRKDAGARHFPIATSTPAAEPRDAQRDNDSNRTPAASADVPLSPAAPRTPIRARSAPRRAASPPPSSGGTLDDTLPPSSPIPSSPLSSPPSASRPSNPGSSCTYVARPATPPRPDAGADAELDLAELVASPPSPTLDALRITSRVAVRALLNPAPAHVSASGFAVDEDDVLPQLHMEMEMEVEMEVPNDDEARVGAEEEVGEERERERDGGETMATVCVLDGDVTPLVLPEAGDAVSEVGEVAVEVEMDVVEGPADVSEEPMAMATATEIRVQIPEPEAASACEARSQRPSQAESEVKSEFEAEPGPCPVPTAQTEPQSRRSSCAPSPARMPHVAQIVAQSQSQEVPSSPLSPTPSSVADVDVDVDIEMGCADADADTELPALVSVHTPVPRPSGSRAASPVPRVQVRDASEPPRKKMRREGDADVSRAEAIVGPKVQAKAKRRRARTPTFTDSESEAEEKAVLKPRTKSAAAANRQADPAAKPARKSSNMNLKRPRVVLSDDEADEVGASSSTVRRRDGEGKDKDKDSRDRKREKPRKARAKAQANLELENEPLHPHPHASTSNTHPHAKQLAKQPAKAAAPPKSVTNIARGEFPSPSSLNDSQMSVSKPSRPVQTPEQDQTNGETASTTKPQKPSATGKSKAPREHAGEIEAEADALVAAFDLPLPAAELEGMLIETLATARASSLASSALFGALMAARPALRDMRLPALRIEGGEGKEEDADREGDGKSRGRGGAKADAAARRAWVPALEAVLEAGWRRSGVFGKIVNSGTDLANHALALEARWFYDPDQDVDEDRAALVRTMMRRPGQRSEARKAKHYYWRPLPKISRWDAEDEL